jgi:hypothetical protein
MKRSFALLTASLATVAALGQTAPPTPAQDPQVTFREMLCGNQGMPPTSTEIPTIGCFRVPSGGTASGMVDGHQFVVAVDAGGKPKCRFDGAAVDCSGCVGQRVPQCPVMLMVLPHDADRSVSFSVQRKADGNRYLFRIDAWNRYLEQRQARQEMATAQAQTTPPALPPGTSAVPPFPPTSPSSSPPLPPGTVPGSVEPTDGPGALVAIGWKAQGAYGSGQFAKLDALIETLSQPDQLTDDGMPRLQGVSEGLWNFLYAWKDWQTELDKIAQWRKELPDAYGPDLVEAILWRAWAWQARGEGSAATVTPEGWELFTAKISRANEVLEHSKNRASRSPLWYQLRLGIARDAGWDHERYRALLDEATQQFPWYLPLYFSAANYLSPKWGGSYAAVDALARRTTRVPLGADYSLYARVYWHLTTDEPIEFELFRDSPASWSLMKAGFEALMKRFPKSKWNLNLYAYLACTANDGSTYGVLRARIGQDVIPNAWASNHSTEVCDEHLLGHT